MLTRICQVAAGIAAAFAACWLVAGDQLTPQHAEAFGALAGIDPLIHPGLLQAAMAAGIAAAFAVAIPLFGMPVWLAQRAFYEARRAMRGEPPRTRDSMATMAACGAALVLCIPLAVDAPVSLAWDALMMAGVAGAGWNLMRAAGENRHAR